MSKESIGALWVKTSSKGVEYMSGTVAVAGMKIEIIAFRNDKGDNERRPDWRIYLQEPKGNMPADDKIPF